ncbi:ribonucleoside triphosphate reductase, partial [Candidatus Collierbacteria bacterium CG10_big_fil_rev_8_21_14_0_10_44_9]
MKKVSIVTLKYIVKRDGSMKAFEVHKIERAVEKAMRATGEITATGPKTVTEAVVTALGTLLNTKDHAAYPTVEEVQDAVERTLME